MSLRIFSTIIVVIAVVLAALVSILPQKLLPEAIFFTRFFDVMLPILAVGALIKYIFTFRDS